LKKNWSELNYDEKKYFKNDEIYFLDKKSKFLRASDIYNSIKSLHAKLKLVSSDDERQEIAIELVELDNKRFSLYKQIDDFS